MSKVLSVFFSCFFVLQVQAQLKDLDITWGDKFDTPKRSYITAIIDSDSSGIYASRERVRLFGVDRFLERYVDLGIDDLVYQDPANSENETFTREIIQVGRDLWELTYSGTREYKRVSARYVNKETLKPSGDEIEIFDIPMVRKLRYSYGSFNYNFSEDRSKTVFVTEYPGDYAEKAKLIIQVRDDLFYTQWEREMFLPYAKDRVDLAYSDVTNQGLAIFMLKVYAESKLAADRRGTEYWYEMLTLDSTGAQHKFKIDLDGLYIRSAHFEPMNEDLLVMAGFFGKRKMDTDGSFYLQVNINDGKIVTKSTRDFELSFLQQGESEGKAQRISRRRKRGRSIGLENVYYRDFVVRKDGGVFLIGEYYDMIVSQGGDQGSSSTTSYIYKDIVVVNISPNGEVEWAKKILKRQITSDDAGLMSGFALYVHSDKLYFIYNDHRKNIDVYDYSNLRTWNRKRRTSIVSLATLTQDGELTKEVIAVQKKLGIEIIPESCKQISEDEMILVTYRKKENQIARLTSK